MIPGKLCELIMALTSSQQGFKLANNRANSTLGSMGLADHFDAQSLPMEALSALDEALARCVIALELLQMTSINRHCSLPDHRRPSVCPSAQPLLLNAHMLLHREAATLQLRSSLQRLLEQTCSPLSAIRQEAWQSCAKLINQALSDGTQRQEALLAALRLEWPLMLTRLHEALGSAAAAATAAASPQGGLMGAAAAAAASSDWAAASRSVSPAELAAAVAVLQVACLLHPPARLDVSSLLLKVRGCCSRGLVCAAAACGLAPALLLQIVASARSSLGIWAYAARFPPFTHAAPAGAAAARRVPAAAGARVEHAPLLPACLWPGCCGSWLWPVSSG